MEIPWGRLALRHARWTLAVGPPESHICRQPPNGETRQDAGVWPETQLTESSGSPSRDKAGSLGDTWGVRVRGFQAVRWLSRDPES